MPQAPVSLSRASTVSLSHSTCRTGGSHYFVDICPDCRCLSPFPELVFSPRNNLESENIPRRALISSHQTQHQQIRCKPLWLKSPRKGRVNAGAGAEIKGSERGRGEAALGSRARKGNFLTAPAAPRAPSASAAPRPEPRLLPTGTPGFSRWIPR